MLYLEFHSVLTKIILKNMKDFLGAIFQKKTLVLLYFSIFKPHITTVEDPPAPLLT